MIGMIGTNFLEESTHLKISWILYGYYACRVEGKDLGTSSNERYINHLLTII